MICAEGKLQPVPGLPEFIEWLKTNNIRRVAVSNAPKPNVEAMLKAIHLEDFFEDIMLGELFERPKPFPDPYLAGLKVVGCKKDEVVIFEDSPAGEPSSQGWCFLAATLHGRTGSSIRLLGMTLACIPHSWLSWKTASG